MSEIQGGAEHLQSIFGTEKDKVNCPFYLKIGACRHGDRCSKIHHKPLISQTILIRSMYQSPAAHLSIVDSESLEFDEEEVTKSLEEFYEDVHGEFTKFGEIEELHVCENLGEHMFGNVYIKYTEEENATKALMNLNGRYYAGRPLYVEYCPVTGFKEARCRQFDQGECSRGGFCNFLHIRVLRRDFLKQLFPKKFERKPIEGRGERDRDYRNDRRDNRDNRDNRDDRRDRDRRDNRDRRDRDYRDDRRDRDRRDRNDRDYRDDRDYKKERENRDGRRDRESSRDDRREDRRDDRKYEERDSRRDSHRSEKDGRREEREEDKRENRKKTRRNSRSRSREREQQQQQQQQPKPQQEEVADDYSPTSAYNN